MPDMLETPEPMQIGNVSCCDAGIKDSAQRAGGLGFCMPRVSARSLREAECSGWQRAVPTMREQMLAPHTHPRWRLTCRSQERTLGDLR
jgi:hypothetical protein